MMTCWNFAAGLARFRSSAHVVPVRLHVPRGCVVTFVHAEDRFQLSLNGRIGDGRHTQGYFSLRLVVAIGQSLIKLAAFGRAEGNINDRV
jgi:hypothetical protein